jgi:hypothetical protein
MSVATSYRVRFAGVEVALQLDHPPAAPLVEHVLGDVRARGRGKADVTLRIAPGARGEEVMLVRGRQRLYQGECNGALALAILDHTVRALVEGSHRGLLFHAGAVAKDGKALLLPGDAGAGKTTLTAWLIGRGFDYLTDELVFMRDRSLLFEAFRRALNVKQGSGPALDGILKLDVPSAALKTPQGYLVAPPRRRRGAGSARLRAIIFPRFHRGAEFSLRALPPGECGLRLMSVLVNTRLRHDRGFAAVTYLARACPAYSLSYGHVDQLNRHRGELEAAAGLATTERPRAATAGARR